MKGQITHDFLISLAVYLVVLLAALGLAMAQFNNYLQLRNGLQARDISIVLGNAINHVYLGGDNTTYSVSYIKEDGVEISVNGRFLIVQAGNGSMYDFPLLTDQVNTTSIASNVLIIKNNKGVVEIAEQ